MKYIEDFNWFDLTQHHVQSCDLILAQLIEYSGFIAREVAA
jgi:hypothetical protein